MFRNFFVVTETVPVTIGIVGIRTKTIHFISIRQTVSVRIGIVGVGAVFSRFFVVVQSIAIRVDCVSSDTPPSFAAGSASAPIQNVGKVVGVQGIRPVHDLLVIGMAVPVRIHVVDVGAQELFLRVGQAIVVGVAFGIEDVVPGGRRRRRRGTEFVFVEKVRVIGPVVLQGAIRIFHAAAAAATALILLTNHGEILPARRRLARLAIQTPPPTTHHLPPFSLSLSSRPSPAIDYFKRRGNGNDGRRVRQFCGAFGFFEGEVAKEAKDGDVAVSRDDGRFFLPSLSFFGSRLRHGDAAATRIVVVVGADGRVLPAGPSQNLDFPFSMPPSRLSSRSTSVLFDTRRGRPRFRRLSSSFRRLRQRRVGVRESSVRGDVHVHVHVDVDVPVSGGFRDGVCGGSSRGGSEGGSGRR
mmetsp:Transcript_8413/g.17943  ORF Transcript_8413/g.17943 Transcript_8413/m.17943 type:complete len:411 (-) Transcript_8413:441-1673(-)